MPTDECAILAAGKFLVKKVVPLIVFD